MEKDSKEKILRDWNALWISPTNSKHPKVFKEYDDMFRELKKFAGGHGKESRIKGYETIDGLYKKQDIDLKTQQKIIAGQTKIRERGHKELLELWARVKALKK
ncbi:MAG: hypothetical protein WC640_02010 [Candidatus Paceibacterota bacterium]|jgi:hypothetical protein